MFTIAEGRKALVTGGASGYGLGVVQRLLGYGVQVAVADADQDALAKAAADLEGDVLILEMDVTDVHSVHEGVGRTVERFGGLDTLVNSAGVFQFRPFEEIPEEEWDWILDVNLKGTFLTCQAAMPHLRESGRGRVVNIASDAGKKGWPLIAHYTASKFGVVGLTQSVAVEFGPYGVTVNAVCPSSTPETGMGQKVLRQKVELGWGETAEEVLRRGAESFPLRRLGTVADVADAIMFLISDNASWITGESLNIDGGSLAG